MFQWAVKEKYLSENPAADLAEDVYRSTGAKKTAARDQREPFTPEELERVFSAAWFSTGTGERTRDGSFFTIGHIIFGYRCWAFSLSDQRVIAALSG